MEKMRIVFNGTTGELIVPRANVCVPQLSVSRLFIRYEALATVFSNLLENEHLWIRFDSI